MYPGRLNEKGEDKLCPHDSLIVVYKSPRLRLDCKLAGAISFALPCQSKFGRMNALTIAPALSGG